MRFTLTITFVALAGALAARPGAAPGNGTTLEEPACRQNPSNLPDLQWIDPPDEPDQEELRRWCRTVGPVAWNAPQENPRPFDEDSLLLVSWNTHVGGGDLDGFLDSLRLGRLTGGRTVADFVFLLQEVFRRGDAVPDAEAGFPIPSRIAPGTARRKDIVEIARERQLWLFYVPSMRNGSDAGPHAEDRGNAILSTRPLSAPVAIALPFEGQRRVALLAEVRGRNHGTSWRLEVCCVHLDNRSSGSRLFASFGAGRLRQARFLLQQLPGGPLILGGDFNTWMPGALERTIPSLRRSFPQSVLEDLHPTYSRRMLPDRRTDHLFFRAPGATPLKVRRVISRFGSDHRAVLAWVSLRTLQADSSETSARVGP